MMEVTKKQTCSTSCQVSCRNASSKAIGRCQPIKVAVPASQQSQGWVSVRPSHFTGPIRKSGPSTPRTNARGSPCKIGAAGAPSRSSGGATAMSRRCCTMCIDKRSSSNASSGDPTAIQSAIIAAPKAARCPKPIASSDACRRRYHPSAYTPTERTSASVTGTGIDQDCSTSSMAGGIGHLGAFAASRAGSSVAGCSVSRNATSAVVSGGFKFLPNAGMLPPPWST